jgi:hypothetical protein
MMKIVTAVETDRKLNILELYDMPKIQFITELYLRAGDMLKTSRYDSLEVLYVKDQSWADEDDNYDFLDILSINGKKQKSYYSDEISSNKNSSKTKNTKSMNPTASNQMFSGILGKYKSQFIPERETNVRMSLSGLLVVPVNGEYVGIDASNTLTSFPEEMTISIPVYSINKMNSAIQVGDIVKTGVNTYAKVIGKNGDGSLKVLTYTGYTRSKKEVKDFIVNQATTRVLINMFNFDNSENSFNPLFFAFANGDHIDVNSLMMLAMTPQGKNLFSNAGGGFNPMMLFMLDQNKGGSSSMFETMAMMSMMGGGNPFANMGNMFNNMTAPAPAPVSVTTPIEDVKPEDVKSDTDEIMEKLNANPDLAQKIKDLLSNKKVK